MLNLDHLIDFLRQPAGFKQEGDDNSGIIVSVIHLIYQNLGW